MPNTQQKPESTINYNPPKLSHKKFSCTEMFEVLGYLQKNEVLCDIKLKTDDNRIIFAHKVILASASPYFCAMFTNFPEINHDLVVMKQLDSTALTLLVDCIYSGQIFITEKNVQALLSAANLLQMQKVKEACCDFLRSRLCPANCIGINAIAELHSCTKLSTSSELYIQKHFLEVVGGDEFLSLPSDRVVKLISSDELLIPSEEEVFESVIRWVKHELDSRKYILPLLMRHVRLSLISKKYILKKVVEEPLMKNCLECKDYIIEALHFHLLKSDELIKPSIRNTPRLGDKVILVVGGYTDDKSDITEWYDPKMNRWHFGPKMITDRHSLGAAVVNDNLVFAMGGLDDNLLIFRSVDVLDLSLESPCWKPSVDMQVARRSFGVGVINDCLYAVGGFSEMFSLSSAEVFDCNTQEWSLISSMSTERGAFGVGVLNNRLYAVGGLDISSHQTLNSVEYYTPSLDEWTPVEKLSVSRKNAGVGVLNGVLYAVGGYCGEKTLSSVEAYTSSTGVWTDIEEMHLPRKNAGVVALDGLLYVVGGYTSQESALDSVECYCPKTETWTIVTDSINVRRAKGGVAVAINRQRHFKS